MFLGPYWSFVAKIFCWPQNFHRNFALFFRKLGVKRGDFAENHCEKSQKSGNFPVKRGGTCDKISSWHLKIEKNPTSA